MLTKDFLEKTDKIPGWLSRREGRLLYEFSKDLGNKGTVVEVGSFQGKSTAFLAQALKETGNKKVFSIDPHLGETHASKGSPKFGETFNKFVHNLKSLKLLDNVEAIRKTSASANKGWKKPIAVLNIDGLHEYEFAKQDLDLWLRYLIKDSVVVCHDAFSPFPEVFAAVKKTIFESGQYRVVGVSDSQIFAIKGQSRSFWEKLNLWRSVYFISLASSIWQNKNIPPKVADFLVKRVLKIFYINKMMVSLWLS